MDIDFVERLERRLGEDLPGVQSQMNMMPSGRDYSIPENGYREACVLILLFLKNKKWHITFIRRTSDHPNDPHAGQIGLPGGALEEEDATYMDCALRETHEEIGVNGEDIGIIGELTPLYVEVSNFLVFPFVGFTNQEPVFEPQPSEVVEVLEVPIDDFLDRRKKKTKDMHIRGFDMKEVPYYDIEGNVLWGATAMIMAELEAVLDEVL